MDMTPVDALLQGFRRWQYIAPDGVTDTSTQPSSPGWATTALWS